tara:strand:+ start:513 stop:725 length:213 start_codon:yes stop_codon:yes gene_type:complete
MTFKENEIYDLESYLGVDKSDHNLEDQIDNLVNEIKLLIDNKNHKKDFIENYNYWVEERIEYEQASEQKG